MGKIKKLLNKYYDNNFNHDTDLDSLKDKVNIKRKNKGGLILFMKTKKFAIVSTALFFLVVTAIVIGCSLNNNQTNRLIVKNAVITLDLNPSIEITVDNNGNISSVYGVNDDITSEEAGSPWSSPIPFYCYTTPTLTWINKPTPSVIQESSYNFQFSYSQSEGEELYSYIINLYDNNQTLISSSGTKYVSGIPSLTYEVYGLIDDNTYYIEINGVTVNNTQISSGKIYFSVNYYEPYSQQIFEVKNDACNGWITITNNPIIVIPESYPSPPLYVKNNTAADLTASESYVKWSGLYHSGNFCIRIWGYEFNSDKTIFTYTENDTFYNLTLFRRDGYDYHSDVLQTYYELQVQVNDNQPYFIYSNYINPPSDSNKIFICIKRINNIYSIYIQKLG